VDVESGNAESGMEHNSTCSLFSVIITLTDEGLDQLCLVRIIVLSLSLSLWLLLLLLLLLQCNLAQRSRIVPVQL